MEVTPCVHCIPISIVNCFLIIDADGLTLIDTGFPGGHKKIIRYIAEHGYDYRNLRRILITHSDADHVGGLAALKTVTGARVYASEIEARAIAEGHSSRRIRARGLAYIQFAVAHIFFRVKPTTVDEFLIDGQVLPILGGLRVVATPGHSPGHVSFFASDAKILFAGDSLASINGELRRSKSIYTWDQEKADGSIRLQAALGAKIVCTAHGEVIMDAAGKFPRV